jgi:hypothetical protein
MIHLDLMGSAISTKERGDEEAPRMDNRPAPLSQSLAQQLRRDLARPIYEGPVKMSTDNPTTGSIASDTLIARCCRAIIERWQKAKGEWR